ncbi:MAG: hypothetical protein MI862_09720 [Desulfobacterales bacterium]|nr:hypothetical protein [Desulfobacterales bacterium]
MPRKTVKVSDGEIIVGAHTTPFWKTLIYKPWSETILLLLKQYFRFNKAMMAFLHWSVFHYKPGSQTMGIILIIFSLSFLLGFNSVHVPALLKPFALFIVPILPFFKTFDELYRLAVTDVESQFLLIYTGLFTLKSAFDLVTIWSGAGNPSLSKRGNSWIALGFSKFMSVNEFVICAFVEPLIAIGIGLAAWKYAGDIHFCVFMIATALAESAQQIFDKAFQTHTQSILNA